MNTEELDSLADDAIDDYIPTNMRETTSSTEMHTSVLGSGYMCKIDNVTGEVILINSKYGTY
jgi:hypothetical protein